MKISLGAKTIAFPLPVWLIGVYGPDGRASAMPASWAGVCNSQPPCVYFSARASRFTYDCVQARRAFTVNIPSAAQAAATDYCGLVSGRGADKLAAVGINSTRAGQVDAPALDGFPLVLECRLVQVLELGTHAMFIGEIADVRCEEAMLTSAGKPDLAKIAPYVYSPADGTYYSVGAALGKAYELGRDLVR